MATYLLRDIGLIHHQRIFVILAFHASLLVTVIAIPLSVLLFVAPTSNATLIFGHVKVCNYFCVLNFR